MAVAELDRPAQHRSRGVGVAGRPEDAGTGELHRAEADAVDGLVAHEGCRVHAPSLRPPPRGDKKSVDQGSDTTTLGGAGDERDPLRLVFLQHALGIAGPDVGVEHRVIV